MSYLISFLYLEFSSSILTLIFHLFLRLLLIFCLATIIIRLSQNQNRNIIASLLIAVTILGLGLRLWEAAYACHRFLETPPMLIGDEGRYDDLAISVLEGEFFQQPVSTPVYPLFLSLFYFVFGHSYPQVIFGQAIIGAISIPLTYFLARRFTDKSFSLLAATFVSVWPILISQVGRLYTEVLYTNLFLVNRLLISLSSTAHYINRLS